MKYYLKKIDTSFHQCLPNMVHVSYIPVQFIKSFCCIEAEKRVKKKFVGTFNFNPRGKKGVLSIPIF
jgi:hypothetical protein